MTRTPDPKDVQVLFIPSREVRVVPKGWQHPETKCLYGRDALEWNDPEITITEDDVMPSVEGLADPETELMAYETSTEGTPISPPFPNAPQGRLGLVAHCAEHCTTWGYETAGPEAWAVILFGNGAAVTVDGVVIAEDR